MNYCQKKFIPKDQYSRTKGSYDRYTQLNFTWTVHGTLEMRSLCMFKDKLLSSAALKFWYDTVNRYLEIKSRRNPIIESKFIINKAEMEPAVFEI